MTTVSALATTLFLGGWHAPWPISMWDGANTGWWPLLWFIAKVWAFLFFFMWLRAHAAPAALRPVHGAGLEGPHPGVAGLDHDRRHHAQPAHRTATPHAATGLITVGIVVALILLLALWRALRARTIRNDPAASRSMTGAFPVPPLPSQRTQPRRSEQMPKFLDAIEGFGVTFGTMFKKPITEQYPEKPGPGRQALSRPPPAQPVSRRAGEVHRLRVVRLGLPGRRHLRRGRRQHRGGAVFARRALRPGLPDQLSALHRLRVVHRGLPHPRADHDQRVRDGRRQPRRPDLGQGQAARADAAGHGGPPHAMAAGQHRRGLLPREHQADSRRRSTEVTEDAR